MTGFAVPGDGERIEASITVNIFNTLSGSWNIINVIITIVKNDITFILLHGVLCSNLDSCALPQLEVSSLQLLADEAVELQGWSEASPDLSFIMNLQQRPASCQF